MPQINFDLTANNEDKVLSKRVPTSAVMKLQMTLPGGKTLQDGVHTIGFLEGNITITRVSVVVLSAFDGAAPTVTITENQNAVTETWFTDLLTDTVAITESGNTEPTVAGKQSPYYRGTKGEWLAEVINGGSTVGEFALLIDYVQMDAEPGKHS